jgi:hypothetical protein
LPDATFACPDLTTFCRLDEIGLPRSPPRQGSGGSFVIHDLDLRMTVAFVMNKHIEAGSWDHHSRAARA